MVAAGIHCHFVQLCGTYARIGCATPYNRRMAPSPNIHATLPNAARTTTSLWAFVIFFVALNLRPAIVAVGPLLTQVGAEFGWGEATMGLLGALPLLAFALFSILVQFATRRFRSDTVLVAALLALAFGCVARSAFDATWVWLGTVLIGGSIAVGNVLAPVIVKRDFPAHLSFATGAYSACVTTGSAIAGLTAAAAAEALGGWRPALALWAVPALAAALLWAVRARRSSAEPQAYKAASECDACAERASIEAPPSRTSLYRKPSTWLVTLFMGLQSAAFYTYCNWLPSIAGAAGFGPAQAGVQLFLFQVIGVFSGLAIPRFMYVRGNQVCAGLLASAPMVIAAAGWLCAPQLSYVWSVIGGVGQGASLVVALTLISLRGTTHAETVALSGVAQSLGYLLAACGPFIFGALAEASGTLAAPLAFMLALACIQCATAVAAGRIPKS